ncbi:uncharacterized protein [Pyrus communis]|uniref:uncharacterized protein n=1 Tax=Pyrus communis TaxID=23211 RepID=UPI0035C206CD
METQSSGKQSVRSVAAGGNSGSRISKAFCRCGEGWKCVITRTEGPDAGKAFFSCAGKLHTYEDGTVTKEATTVNEEVEKIGANEAYCECGEGWKCVISKVEPEDPDAGKSSFECAGSCSCVTDG